MSAAGHPFWCVLSLGGDRCFMRLPPRGYFEQIIVEVYASGAAYEAIANMQQNITEGASRVLSSAAISAANISNAIAPSVVRGFDRKTSSSAAQETSINSRTRDTVAGQSRD